MKLNLSDNDKKTIQSSLRIAARVLNLDGNIHRLMKRLYTKFTPEAKFINLNKKGFRSLCVFNIVTLATIEYNLINPIIEESSRYDEMVITHQQLYNVMEKLNGATKSNARQSE